MELNRVCLQPCHVKTMFAKVFARPCTKGQGLPVFVSPLEFLLPALKSPTFILTNIMVLFANESS